MTLKSFTEILKSALSFSLKNNLLSEVALNLNFYHHTPQFTPEIKNFSLLSLFQKQPHPHSLQYTIANIRQDHKLSISPHQNTHTHHTNTTKPPQTCKSGSTPSLFALFWVFDHLSRTSTPFTLLL